MVNKNKQNGEAESKQLPEEEMETGTEGTTDEEEEAPAAAAAAGNTSTTFSSIRDDAPVDNNGQDEENADDGTFEVEQIVDMECKKRWRCPVKFRVRWVGYSEKDDTWLPASELNCEDLINEFLEISGRTVEYKNAMSSKKRAAPAGGGGGEGAEMTMQTRKAARYCYSELDEDADEVIPAGTRTRKPKSRPEPKQHKPASPKKKHPGRGRSAVPEKREYEVEAVVDHRVRGRFTEYKVRWKGFGPKDDSWLGEAELNCDTLLNKYFKQAGTNEEQAYEVQEIKEMRKGKGGIEYKVRWKGWSAKYDSWLPKDELNCPDLLKRFHTKHPKEEDEDEQVAEEEEQAYEVQEIKEMRKGKGGIEYKVRWKGFNARHDSWLPKDELNCPDLLKRFHTNYPKEEDEDEQLHEEDEQLHEEEEFEVEKILDERKKQGRIQYLVQWKNKGPRHNSWEPEENLENALAALEKYKNSLKSKKGKATPKGKKPAKKKVNMTHESSPEVEPPPPPPSKAKKGSRRSVEESPAEVETPSRSRRSGKNRSYSDFYDQ